ncbi:uncharacterized protein [Antedon mediterranea]|uniref:uncharacterized protein n=1 Tax=Antedon mediterranea TaxID=105859 RepID=UPI003AF6F533
MPRLSTLAKGYGSWDGSLQREDGVVLKGVTKPILPQYLGSEEQSFYKQKTVKFPIRTKSDHLVIKTIIAEAERIKSSKSRKHDDPRTVAEEIQSNARMTQPSREQSSPSSPRVKSSPECRTNHKCVQSHIRTKSAPAASTKFTIKPNGEMQLPKTYITRKGAMVLFTAPSKIKFTKEGRCCTSHRKTKKDISNLSLSLGTLKKLCTSVLEYGDVEWTADELDSLASQQFHKTCMRFIRDQEGQECLDYRVQPGSDFKFYLRDMQKQAVVRNLMRWDSAHSLTSTEAAEELNEAFDNVDTKTKQDEVIGKPDLISADASRLAESMSKAAYSRPSTQNSERTFSRGDKMIRLGSGRSISSTRTSTPLSCAKLTASLKSANYLGRTLIAPYSQEEDEVAEGIDETAGVEGRDFVMRQKSIDSSHGSEIMQCGIGIAGCDTAAMQCGDKADTQCGDGLTDGDRGDMQCSDELGDGGGDDIADVRCSSRHTDDGDNDNESIKDSQNDLEESIYNDIMSVEISLTGSRKNSYHVGEHGTDEVEDTADGHSSRLSRRSRRSSAQRSKTPGSTTTSVINDDEEDLALMSENEQNSAVLSHFSSDGKELNDKIETDSISEDGALSLNATEASKSQPAINSSTPTKEKVRPLTSGSSRHSVRSVNFPASAANSVLESDFNEEQLQSIYDLDDEASALPQAGEENRDTRKIETDDQINTELDKKPGLHKEDQISTEISQTSGPLTEHQPEITSEDSPKKTSDRQSLMSASSKSSESAMQRSSLMPHPPENVYERKETPSDDVESRIKTSLKREEKSKQFIKISEPKPPPPRIPSAKPSLPRIPSLPPPTIQTQQSSSLTPKPPATKNTASILKKVTTPVHAGTPTIKKQPPESSTSTPVEDLDLFSLKSITNRSKPNIEGKKPHIEVNKTKVIGGPDLNDSLLTETYEEPSTDEIEKMIQEELEKELKEQGLIEVPESDDQKQAENLQQEETTVNFDTDDETIKNVVKESNKGKKKSKKQILKEREELRELRRREKKLKEEEAKALKAKKKAEEEEKRRLEEEEKRNKIEMEEEMQDALREAESAKEAEEQARLMLLESRKVAREEREAKRKAEMERKKEEKNKQREERKKMEEAARKREQEMKDKLASVEDIIRQKELEREMEWEREEREREEREELERQEEEEKQKMEEEEERIRELEKEAEEEALSRLVKERREAEERMKIAAIEAEKQKEKEELIRLEQQRIKAKEEEERRLEELEKERLREIEKQRLLQIKKAEEEARARVLKKLEGQKIWAMRRREANREHFSHLNNVRRTQGTTRPWVFSYYVHWPRQTYEKRLTSTKKKQRRPAGRKPPADKPVEPAS